MKKKVQQGKMDNIGTKGTWVNGVQPVQISKTIVFKIATTNKNLVNYFSYYRS